MATSRLPDEVITATYLREICAEIIRDKKSGKPFCLTYETLETPGGV